MVRIGSTTTMVTGAVSIGKQARPTTRRSGPTEPAREASSLPTADSSSTKRRGWVGLVNANPAKFDVVSKFRVEKGSGPYWAHMAIDKGILYLRHGELLAAYKIK